MHIYFLPDSPLVLDLDPLSDHKLALVQVLRMLGSFEASSTKINVRSLLFEFSKLAEFTACCQIANTCTNSVEHKLNTLQSHLPSWFCDKVLASEARGWVLNSLLRDGGFLI